MYLHNNRDALGVAECYRLKNALVDSVIKLDDGRVILVEVKYVLNWFKSCNARVEFQRFMAEKLYECDVFPFKKPPEAALIVFERFSNDWDRTSSSHSRKNGWNFFYEEENALRKAAVMLPIDIIQLTVNGRTRLTQPTN